MRHSYKFLAATAVLISMPAMAGNLSFDNGQTTWRSTQCQKPTPPASIMSAGSDASGEDLNSLINQHNAFTDAAQNYMNCVSGEADRDQTLVNQQIAASAQREIGEMQAEVNQSGSAMQDRESRAHR